MLRDCVIGGASEAPARLDIVLLHPRMGVALLELPPHWTPDAPGRLLRRLEQARFGAIFPGHLPVAHRRLRHQDVAELRRLLTEAFAALPPLSLPGGDAWTLAVRRALQEDPAVRPPPPAIPHPIGEAEAKQGPGIGAQPLLLIGAALLVGALTILAALNMPPEETPPWAASAEAPAGAARAPSDGAEDRAIAGPAPVTAAAPAPLPGHGTPSPPAATAEPPEPPPAAASTPQPIGDAVATAESPSPPASQPPEPPPRTTADTVPGGLPPEPPPTAVTSGHAAPAQPEAAPGGAAQPPEEAPSGTAAAPPAPEPPAEAASGPTLPAPEPEPPAPAAVATVAPEPAMPETGAQPPPPGEPAPVAEATPVRPPAAPAAAAPATAAAAAAGRASPALLAALIRRGDALFELGDVSGARRFYERAAEAGSAEAALALGRTFDPAVLVAAGALGIRPDPDAAAAWYRRAEILRAAAATGGAAQTPGANR